MILVSASLSQNLSTSALLTFGAGRFRFGGCPTWHRMLSSIPGFYPLDVRGIFPTTPVLTTQSVSRHHQMFSRENKIASRLRAAALNSLTIFIVREKLRKFQHLPIISQNLMSGTGRNCLPFPVGTRTPRRMDENWLRWDFESHKGKGPI